MISVSCSTAKPEMNLTALAYALTINLDTEELLYLVSLIDTFSQDPDFQQKLTIYLQTMSNTLERVGASEVIRDIPGRDLEEIEAFLNNVSFASSISTHNTK